MSEPTIGLTVQRLLDRLDAIAASLNTHSGALALLGLGSVRLSVDRADRFYDLDFFVIAEASSVGPLRDDLNWLSSVQPLAFTHKNTLDSCKILFKDGIFAEFAVFSPRQLSNIPFQEGRLVWARTDFDPNLGVPTRHAEPIDPTSTISEALTCLFVGLGRYRRGELLAAQRLIQGSALYLVLKAKQALHGAAIAADPFNSSRRVEQLWPDRIDWLRQACAGSGHSIEAAQVLLSELSRIGPLPTALVTAIELLLHEPDLKDEYATV
jgi:hypothetical protein